MFQETDNIQRYQLAVAESIEVMLCVKKFHVCGGTFMQEEQTKQFPYPVDQSQLRSRKHMATGGAARTAEEKRLLGCVGCHEPFISKC
jgi:hypothetical protein